MPLNFGGMETCSLLESAERLDYYHIARLTGRQFRPWRLHVAATPCGKVD
jgi:hypothetical protein